MKAKTLPPLETLRSLLDYNAETGEMRWQNYAGFKNKLAKSTTSTGYMRLQIQGKSFLTHRIAWKMIHGTDPVNQIDHVNKNPKDNRISNLREATESQNKWNRPAQQNNTSNIKGVSFWGGRNHWAVQISCRGKRYRKAGFLTAREAEVHIIQKREEIHGVFSCH